MSASEKLPKYSWIGIGLIVVVGALWKVGAFDNPTHQAKAAPDDPYLSFYPGETVSLDNEYNASCLNQHLPFSVAARWDYETHIERINFTYKFRKWSADLVLKRIDRQNGRSPLRVRVHERTIESCYSEPDTVVEGKEYVRSVVSHSHETASNCVNGSKVDWDGVERVCISGGKLSIHNGTLVLGGGSR